MGQTKKIRIVHCTIATGFGGGIARMDTFYHQYLDRDRFEILFVIPEEKNPDEIPYNPDIQYIFTGLENRFGKLLQLFSTADIVVFAGGFGPMVCEAARTAKVPALVEIMHLTEPGQLYPNIDVSICVSETVRRAQPIPGKTVVIHNGIDPDQFPFREEPRDANKIILLESSRREKPKHFHLDELADDILPLHLGIEIWLAGRNHYGQSNERVKFLGLRTDIDELYRKADLMVLLSKLEPFGLVALEAMASGCLPIVSDDGGMGEIVTHGVDGWLVPAHDKTKVVETIRQALAMRGTEKWETMRRAARDTVEKRFSARQCVAQYETVFLDLIDRKGGRKEIGPLTGEMSPDAIVDEILSFYNLGRWDMLEKSARSLAGNPAPLKVPLCADIAAMFAMQSVSRGKDDIADMVFGKLFHSGYRRPDMLKTWLSIMPENAAELDDVIKELLQVTPDDMNLILLSVERKLVTGYASAALDELQNAIARLPGNEELKSIYEMLKNKISTQ